MALLERFFFNGLMVNKQKFKNCNLLLKIGFISVIQWNEFF